MQRIIVVCLQDKQRPDVPIRDPEALFLSLLVSKYIVGKHTGQLKEDVSARGRMHRQDFFDSEPPLCDPK